MATSSLSQMKKIQNIKYKIPFLGRILKDRDVLQTERDNLLILLKNKSNSISFNFKKLSNKYSSSLTGLNKYLKGKKNIFDIGTGPNGSPWWKEIDKNASITGIDLYFFPKSIPSKVTIYKFDASKLDLLKPKNILKKYISLEKFKPEKVNLFHKHDLVVANHVLEHVSNPESLIKGINNVIKKGGIVYTGFPDFRNFTDTFYHLIHPDGGGHIQQLTNEIVKNLFEKYGFKLIECNIWPDDWSWLQYCYDPKNFGIEHIDQYQIDYICNTFRKELTPKKGYFYGWEMIFKKL